MELPLVDNPENPGQSIAITVIDEQIKNAENALKQLKAGIEDGNKQIAQLNANRFGVEGQLAGLKEVRKRISDLETANNRDTASKMMQIASELPPVEQPKNQHPAKK